MSMDSLARREATDGSARTRLNRFMNVMRIICTLFIFLTMTATLISDTSEVAASTDLYTYNVGLERIDGATIISLTLYDVDNTYAGRSDIGAKLFVFETYLKSDGENEINLRDTRFIEVCDVNFGMGSTPYAQADISDLYNNDTTFWKADSNKINCKVSETKTGVRFTAVAYADYIKYAVVDYSKYTDEESLYDYLSQVGYTSDGRPETPRYTSTYVTVWCISAEYSLDGETWMPCGEHDSGDDITALFAYEDFEDGDTVWYRGLYAEGVYSKVASYTFKTMKIEVDPNGGDINGYTDTFMVESYGVFDGKEVAVAQVYEAMPADFKFAVKECVREGYVFKGFEVIEGDGSVGTENMYYYKARATICYIKTQKIVNPLFDITAWEGTSLQNDEEAYSVAVEHYNNTYKSTRYDVQSVEVQKQLQTTYYISSDSAYVRVRAVWKLEKESTAVLVKTASSSYNNTLYKRTVGDEKWIEMSKMNVSVRNAESISGVNLLHYTLSPAS